MDKPILIGYKNVTAIHEHIQIETKKKNPQVGSSILIELDAGWNAAKYCSMHFIRSTLNNSGSLLKRTWKSRVTENHQ